MVAPNSGQFPLSARKSARSDEAGAQLVPFSSSKEDSGIEMRAERWTGCKPHAGKHPEAVTMVKRLRRANPVTRKRRSLRKIADELTAAGRRNERGASQEG